MSTSINGGTSWGPWIGGSDEEQDRAGSAGGGQGRQGAVFRSYRNGGGGANGFLRANGASSEGVAVGGGAGGRPALVHRSSGVLPPATTTGPDFLDQPAYYLDSSSVASARGPFFSPHIASSQQSTSRFATDYNRPTLAAATSPSDSAARDVLARAVSSAPVFTPRQACTPTAANGASPASSLSITPAFRPPPSSYTFPRPANATPLPHRTSIGAELVASIGVPDQFDDAHPLPPNALYSPDLASYAPTRDAAVDETSSEPLSSFFMLPSTHHVVLSRPSTEVAASVKSGQVSSGDSGDRLDREEKRRLQEAAATGRRGSKAIEIRRPVPIRSRGSLPELKINLLPVANASTPSQPLSHLPSPSPSPSPSSHGSDYLTPVDATTPIGTAPPSPRFLPLSLASTRVGEATSELSLSPTFNDHASLPQTPPESPPVSLVRSGGSFALREMEEGRVEKADTDKEEGERKRAVDAPAVSAACGAEDSEGSIERKGHEMERSDGEEKGKAVEATGEEATPLSTTPPLSPASINNFVHNNFGRPPSARPSPVPSTVYSPLIASSPSPSTTNALPLTSAGTAPFYGPPRPPALGDSSHPSTRDNRFPSMLNPFGAPFLPTALPFFPPAALQNFNFPLLPDAGGALLPLSSPNTPSDFDRLRDALHENGVLHHKLQKLFKRHSQLSDDLARRNGEVERMSRTLGERETTAEQALIRKAQMEVELRAEQGARQKVEREWAAAERVARTEGTAKELALGRVAQLEREVESVKGYLKEEKKVGEERVRVVREKLEGALKEEKAANAAKLAEAEQRLKERLTEEKEKLEKELKEEMDKVKKEAEENGDEAVWVEQVRELKAELKARQDDVMMLEEDKVKAAEAAKKEKEDLLRELSTARHLNQLQADNVEFLADKIKKLKAETATEKTAAAENVKSLLEQTRKVQREAEEAKKMARKSVEEEREKAKREVDGAQAAFRGAVREIAYLEALLEGRSSELDLINRQHAEVDQLLAEQLEANEQLQTLVADRCSALEARLEERKKELVKTKQRAGSALKAEHEKVEQLQAVLKEREATSSAMERSMEGMGRLMKNLREKLDASTAREKKLGKEFAAWQEEADSNITALCRDLEKHATRLEEKQKRIEELEREKESRRPAPRATSAFLERLSSRGSPASSIAGSLAKA